MGTEQQEFRGQRHINAIRQSLWCGREFGRAAIMVGAGFSRNAERMTERTPSFPLWRDLAEAMRQRLDEPSTTTSRMTPDEALATADRFEEAFGRSALDAFLLESIPDANYLPGRLHELLLTLPWSDVFTTNYDTLIERARTAVFERKYDLICCCEDIPNRMKPRITKLNGSFPSHRPFVITKRDFDSYEDKRAPFVNMVRQSIMENVLCLLGFSGDDPNFRRWVSWVRDYLKNSTLPIYLCGVLDLDPESARELAAKCITPIDLGPVFPKPDWPDKDLRRRMASEWFLLNLLQGEPPNVREWPRRTPKRAWTPPAGCPPIPEGPPPLTDPGTPYPKEQRPSAEEVRGLLPVWRAMRTEYPGWIMPPGGNRESLWYYTENWVWPVLEMVGGIPIPENIHLLYELNWRVERTLTPLYMDWVRKMTPVVESFNPYPSRVELPSASVRPDVPEYSDSVNWSQLGEEWVALAFALAREAREDQDQTRFEMWMARLEKVATQHTDWLARWHWEKCLFHLARLDQGAVSKVLDTWPSQSKHPFWEVRRAAILAELGRVKDAERIAEESLAEIRRRIEPYAPDYQLLSQEGWTMHLLRVLKVNAPMATSDVPPEYRDRWEKLGAFSCNPGPEVELAELTLKAHAATLAAHAVHDAALEPGPKNTSFSFHCGLGIADDRPAFAILRMFEECAVPPLCGNVTVSDDAVALAAESFLPSAPAWALSMLLRAHRRGDIARLYDQVRVAALPEQEVISIHQMLVKALAQAVRSLAGKPYGFRVPPEASFSRGVIESACTLLSTLAFRLPKKAAEELLDLSRQAYVNDVFKGDLGLHKCIGSLFRGALNALEYPDVLRHVADLLSLPIPSKGVFNVNPVDSWPEPFWFVDRFRHETLPTSFDRAAWNGPIAALLRTIGDGSLEERSRATTRLGFLGDIGALTPDETCAFAQAIWAKINDEASPQLPVPRFYTFALLRLPEVESGQAERFYRKRMLTLEPTRIVEVRTSQDGKMSKVYHMTDAGAVYFQDILGGTRSPFPWLRHVASVEWNPDEAVRLFDKARAWWNDEKRGLEKASSGIPGPFLEGLLESCRALVRALGHAILPSLKGSSDHAVGNAGLLVADLADCGICVLEAQPGLLVLNAAESAEVARKIREGFDSADANIIDSAGRALFLWLAIGSEGMAPVPPSDLLDEIVNRTAARRQPGLLSMLWIATSIAERMPGNLTLTHRAALCNALGHLATETDLPEACDQTPRGLTSLPVPVLQRPRYRCAAAQLAFRLSQAYMQEGGPLPDALTQWKKISQGDPLPEVRRAWVARGTQ
jgi:hypothetical protein